MKKNLLLLEIKNRIFRMVLYLSVISLVLVGLVNVFNRRPFINFVLPVIVALLICGLIWLYNQNKFRSVIKYSYLILLNIIYLPLAWLTSPGSYSAMSFYAVLIVFAGIIIALHIWDYIFPLISVFEVIVLLNYEPKAPSQFMVYSGLETRAIDLSINFIVVSIILFAILYVVNNYFDSEHERVYSLSITDQLTGIFNRRYLYTQLEKYEENSDDMDKEFFAILMMDLDNFKRINDTYGHLEGDLVLKEFGLVLKNACRKSDLPVRYGGDEFVIVLPNTTESDIESIKSRIMDLFTDTLKKYEHIGLSISFGTAISQGSNVDEVLQQADNHLYKVKVDFKKMQSTIEKNNT